MSYASIQQLLGLKLRIIIIECIAENTFGLKVCTDEDNIQVITQAARPYVRDSIEKVLADISLLDTGDIFIHQNVSLAQLDLPDYLVAHDYGNGIIHIMPVAYLQLDRYINNLPTDHNRLY